MTYLKTILARWSYTVQQKPLYRGMITYAVTWPASSFIQQSFQSKESHYDYKRIIQFSLYGTFFVAPTLFGWMTFASIIWKKNTLPNAIIKATVEQVTYGPFAICCYLYGMSLFDGADHNDAKKEVSEKFMPTWKVGALVWPVIQTINYTYIPEKNRVPFVSLCSFMWTIFLAFVKYQGQ